MLGFDKEVRNGDQHRCCHLRLCGSRTFRSRSDNRKKRSPSVDFDSSLHVKTESSGLRKL